MTTKELTPQQTFEEKIKDRIRADIGDLIPDEMLREMVKRSLEDFFFKDTEHQKTYGGIEKRPGWFHNFLKGRLERRLDKMIYRHIVNNGQQMIALIEADFIKEAPRIIMAAFVKNLMEAPVSYGMNALMDFENRIRNARSGNL